MIQVRQGVFETNSSSTHVLCIAREKTKPLDRIEFRLNNFGWGHDVYHDPSVKASYVYTAACAYYKKDMADRISELLSPYGIECIFIEHPIYDKYGIEENPHLYLKNGGIDHVDECEDILNKLLNDPALLIDFIFGDKSYLETGNDNDEDEYPACENPQCEHIFLRK